MPIRYNSTSLYSGIQAYRNHQMKKNSTNIYKKVLRILALFPEKVDYKGDTKATRTHQG